MYGKTYLFNMKQAGFPLFCFLKDLVLAVPCMLTVNNGFVKKLIFVLKS